MEEQNYIKIFNSKKSFIQTLDKTVWLIDSVSVYKLS